MVAYANLHLAFEQMRIRARRVQKKSPDATSLADAEKQPPRILMIGPENSGKTTACKILANYATRTGQQWSPMLVNVDPNEVSLIALFIFMSKLPSRVPGRFLALYPRHL